MKAMAHKCSVCKKPIIFAGRCYGCYLKAKQERLDARDAR